MKKKTAKSSPAPLRLAPKKKARPVSTEGETGRASGSHSVASRAAGPEQSNAVVVVRPHGSYVVPSDTLSSPEARDRELLKAWLAGKSPGTVRGYQGALAHLGRFLSEQMRREISSAAAVVGTIVGMSQGDAHFMLQLWTGSMADAGVARSTVAWRLSAVRSVLDLAVATGRCAWSLRMRTPKMDAGGATHTVVEAKSGREAWLRLRGHLEGSQQWAEVRDLAMFRLMHDCALRRFEVCGLDLEHVDLERMVIAIRGKGRQRRELVPLPEPTAKALIAWLVVRGKAGRPLFTNADRSRKGGGRLTPGGLSSVLARRRRELGIELRPHDLRRLGITRALELNSGDIAKTMPYSRHKNPQTLVGYDVRRREIPRATASGVADD